MPKTCGDPVFKPLRSELLAEASEELLRHMLKAFPSDQRVSFLLEIFETLTPREKLGLYQAVSREISRLGQEGLPAAADPVAVDGAGYRAETAGEPSRSPKVPAFRDLTAGPAAAGGGTVRRSPPRPDKRAVEAEFQKFTIQNSLKNQSQKTDMRKQLISCLGLGLLILSVLTLLSIGGRKIYDWLLLMMG